MEIKTFRRIINAAISDKMALIVATGLLMFLTYILFQQIKRLESSSELISHSMMVNKEINNLFQQFDLLESSEFKSLVLKDSTSGNSYADHRRDTDKALKKLNDLVQDLPYYQAHLDSIDRLKDSLHTTLTDLKGKIPSMGNDLAAMMYAGKTATILKKIRDIKFFMLAHNEKLMRDRLAAHRKNTFFTPLTSLLLGVFSLAVFFVAFIRLHGQKNKIQSSETLLQNIVQSTDNIMNYYEPIHDANGKVVDFKIMFANICNKDYLDLEPDAIMGKRVSEVFPFVLKNNELERMIDCFHNNETIDFEREVTVKGERYWFHTFIRAIDKGILEVARNNTEEYNAKEDLLHVNEELKIQNFIMSEAKRMAKIGSYIWSFESDKAEFSDNFYHILDYGPDGFELTFETYRDFVHPEDLQEYDEFGQWLKEEQKPREHTYRIISKKGRIKYLRAKGQFVQRDGRKVMIGVVQDVSEQIKAENDLKIINQELKRNNIELESFNRVASHDLQEPLRKIQMFISRIDDGDKLKLSERGREYVDRIDKVAARMQSLIRNLLTYAQIGNKQEDFENVDLNIVLKKVQEDFSDQISDANGEIISQKLPEVRGVFFQLEQLFGNLILNALKYYSPTVPPKIELKAETVPHEQIPGDFIKQSKLYHRISVIDNGIGFDKEYATKIFEVFQRLHPNTEYSGTGIGLAICKKIVENHHGFIHAESALGKGSVFTIYLPV